MEENDGNPEDGKGTSFWKKNNRAVPGRPSPRKDVKTINSFSPSSSSSFQDFQQSISDAWDLGDDEFCNISNLKISKKVSQTAAENVINIHKYKCSECVPNKRQIECDKDENILGKSDIDKGDPRPKVIHKFNSELDLQLLGFHFAEEKIIKFKCLLESSLLNLSDLQNLSWPGIPFPVKADTWRLLAGYTPTCLELRDETLKKKRAEYWNYVSQYYETEARDDIYQGTYRQIHIDIPRMSPTISLFRQKVVQQMFERILFIWSVRHPASGYVQGINDLVTPFFIVFLHQVLPKGTNLDEVDISLLDEEKRNIVEADSYWCFCKFLDGIQDNYIFPQLGIQHKINRLRELIQRLDGVLHNHLQKNGVEYLQFSFRWMNNLLTRELPLRCLIRLWDTYLAELDTFSSFQLFVCAAFLLHWRQDLMVEKDFQGLMLFLQNLPTQTWNDSDINLLVAEAYRLKCTFADAPNHFQSKDS